MINYNPETYSTDFDTADKLYFEELSYERVLDVYEMENASSVVVSFGGQLPQNIALKLQETGGATILGTDPKEYVHLSLITTCPSNMSEESCTFNCCYPRLGNFEHHPSPFINRKLLTPD